MQPLLFNAFSYVSFALLNAFSLREMSEIRLIFTVDFIDVCFNSVNNTYQPYHKPSNKPVYIHKQSYDPPNNLKDLQKSINKRISDISWDENVFNNAKLTYEKALNHSGGIILIY